MQHRKYIFLIVMMLLLQNVRCEVEDKAYNFLIRQKRRVRNSELRSDLDGMASNGRLGYRPLPKRYFNQSTKRAVRRRQVDSNGPGVKELVSATTIHPAWVEAFAEESESSDGIWIESDMNEVLKHIPGHNRHNKKGRMSAQNIMGGQYVPEPLDTDAEFGDTCTPAGELEWDYCELAPYPNKGRMMCATKDLDPENAGKCVCKFYKTHDEKWKQMRYDEKKKLCLSPKGGICYAYVPEEQGETKSSEPKYRQDMEAGHQQCDDPEPLVKNSENIKICKTSSPRNS